MITIVIAEDQTLLSESLSIAINAQDDMEVVATYASAADACKALASGDVCASLALLDVCTAEGSSGIEAARSIKDACPGTKVIIMTGMPDVSFVERAASAGADSFIYKNEGTAQLLGVIRSTMEGYSTFPYGNGKPQALASLLTPLELDIVRKACEAKSRKEIAAELFMSEGTAKRHISAILAKTGYDSLTRLAVRMIADGHIVPDVK